MRQEAASEWQFENALPSDTYVARPSTRTIHSCSEVRDREIHQGSRTKIVELLRSRCHIGSMTSVVPLLFVHHHHKYIGGTESAAACCGRVAVHGLGGDVAEDINHIYPRFLEPTIDFTFQVADFGFYTLEDLNLLHWRIS